MSAGIRRARVLAPVQSSFLRAGDFPLAKTGHPWLPRALQEWEVGDLDGDPDGSQAGDKPCLFRVLDSFDSVRSWHPFPGVSLSSFFSWKPCGTPKGELPCWHQRAQISSIRGVGGWRTGGPTCQDILVEMEHRKFEREPILSFCLYAVVENNE